MNKIFYADQVKAYCDSHGLDYSKLLTMRIVHGIDFYKVKSGDVVVLLVSGHNENDVKIEQTEYTRRYLSAS